MLCDGVKTERIPLIFCLIPEFVKNEVTVRVKYIIMDDFFRNKFVKFYENEDSYNEFKLLNIITGHRTYIEIIDECLECIGMKEVI